MSSNLSNTEGITASRELDNPGVVRASNVIEQDPALGGETYRSMRFMRSLPGTSLVSGHVSDCLHSRVAHRRLGIELVADLLVRLADCKVQRHRVLDLVGPRVLSASSPRKILIELVHDLGVLPDPNTDGSAIISHTQAVGRAGLNTVGYPAEVAA